MKHLVRSTLVALAIGALLVPAAHAQTPADPLHVYGPGGPAPAMREAAKAYEARTGRAVAVVAGIVVVRRLLR